MQELELGVAIAPDELLGAMVEQYSAAEMTDFVMALPRHIKDKKFVQDVYDMYGKVLKIYDEAGK